MSHKVPLACLLLVCMAVILYWLAGEEEEEYGYIPPEMFSEE